MGLREFFQKLLFLNSVHFKKKVPGFGFTSPKSVRDYAPAYAHSKFIFSLCVSAKSKEPKWNLEWISPPLNKTEPTLH